MNKLLFHPAAKNSQLTKIVKHLKTHFTEILAYKDHDSNHGKKSVLDMKVKLCGILENVLIQVVIQGKDFDEVIIVESQKPKAAFLHLFGNKNSINF